MVLLSAFVLPVNRRKMTLRILAEQAELQRINSRMWYFRGIGGTYFLFEFCTVSVIFPLSLRQTTVNGVPV